MGLQNWTISEWSLFVSLIALVISVMALPTIFQMFWGRPSLQVNLDDCQVENNKALRCLIINKPISSNFLSFMGVIRQSTEIFGQLTVSEAGSGKIIVEPIRVYFITEKEKGKQVALTSLRPAIFLVAVYKETGASLIVDTNEQLESPRDVKLERGRYEVMCTIYHSDGRTLKFTAEFLVGATISDFSWHGFHPKTWQ